MYTSLCTEADLIQAAFSGWLHIKMDVTVMPSIIIIDIYSIISMVIYTVSGFPLPLQCYVSVGVTWKPELWCSSVECSINILMLHCACVCVREREREREREGEKERERERERERETQKSWSVSMTTSAEGGRSLTNSPLARSFLVTISIRWLLLSW